MDGTGKRGLVVCEGRRNQKRRWRLPWKRHFGRNGKGVPTLSRGGISPRVEVQIRGDRELSVLTVRTSVNTFVGSPVLGTHNPCQDGDRDVHGNFSVQWETWGQKNWYFTSQSDLKWHQGRSGEISHKRREMERVDTDRVRVRGRPTSLCSKSPPTCGCLRSSCVFRLRVSFSVYHSSHTTSNLTARCSRGGN